MLGTLLVCNYVAQKRCLTGLTCLIPGIVLHSRNVYRRLSTITISHYRHLITYKTQTTIEGLIVSPIILWIQSPYFEEHAVIETVFEPTSNQAAAGMAGKISHVGVKRTEAFGTTRRFWKMPSTGNVECHLFGKPNFHRVKTTTLKLFLRSRKGI